MPNWLSFVAILAIPIVIPLLFTKIRKRFFPPKNDPVSNAFDKHKNGVNQFPNSVIGGSHNPNNGTGPT